MTARTWTTGDAIAEHDGDTWHLGTVTGVDAGTVCIRFDSADRATFRRASSPRLADPEQVPIDERSWVPAKVRDQLVRQEAAGRLREVGRRLDNEIGRGTAGILASALDFDDLLAADAACAADAARALLAPAPQSATTP
jgi:hypothetical protein